MEVRNIDDAVSEMYRVLHDLLERVADKLSVGCDCLDAAFPGARRERDPHDYVYVTAVLDSAYITAGMFHTWDFEMFEFNHPGESFCTVSVHSDVLNGVSVYCISIQYKIFVQEEEKEILFDDDEYDQAEDRPVRIGATQAIVLDDTSYEEYDDDDGVSDVSDDSGAPYLCGAHYDGFTFHM